MVVWAGIDEGNIVKKISDDKRWSHLEHHSVVKTDVQNGLFRLTEGERPRMYVIAPNSIVQTVMEFEPEISSNLRERLARMINLEASEPPIQEASPPQLGEESLLRIRKLLEELPRPNPLKGTAMTIQFKGSRCFNRGITEYEVEPLSIQYTLKEEGQADFYLDLQNKIVEGLERREYAVNATADERVGALQFDLSCNKTQELLDKHELKSRVPVLVCHTYDFRKGTAWERIEWVGQPHAVYDGPKSLRRAERFVKDLLEYTNNAPRKYHGFRCQKMLPFKTTDVPFFGLEDLNDYKSGKPAAPIAI